MSMPASRLRLKIRSEQNTDLKETEMYTHPDTMYSVATEVQRLYLADAEQRRLVRSARRGRRSRKIARHRR
jgi:hypothetical protein